MKFKLNEDTINDAIARELNQGAQGMDNPEPVVVDDTVKEVKMSGDGDIERALDRAYKTSKRMQKTGRGEYQGILLVGEAGTGKTSRVRAWAQDNGINLLIKQASSMDDTDLGGALTANKDVTVAVRLASTEFDDLEKPNSVLFLDEYNRASTGVRQTLLQLINDHMIPDAREDGGMRVFPNLLFVVCAMNPEDGYNTGDTLDRAERSRLRRVDVVPDKRSAYNYMTKVYTKEIEQADDPQEARESEGRLRIAQKLLSNSSFKFDTAQDSEQSEEEGNGQILNTRTLAKLLDLCDGTKEDFLDLWNDYCNSLKKPVVERILADYVDVPDKANDALKKYGDAQPVFKQREKTLWDEISDQL